MPIHLRAEPGDYADACLLPGDPLRAKYISETFLEDVAAGERRARAPRLHGHLERKPVSVQGTGMGCPSATIVFEELVQLGVKRLLRVGTCGGLQADHALGDLIVAISAVPADATATHLVGGEPHCPTASWELVHEAVHVAKHTRRSRFASGRSSRATSSTTRTRASTSAGRSAGSSPSRWRPRHSSRSPRSAACTAGCLLTVSDIVVEGEFVADLRRRAPRRGRPDDADRARHRHGGRRRPLARPHRLPRQPGFGRRLDRAALAGDRAPCRGARAGRATRSSPNGPGSSARSPPGPCETARGCSSSSAATAR